MKLGIGKITIILFFGILIGAQQSGSFNNYLEFGGDFNLTFIILCLYDLTVTICRNMMLTKKSYRPLYTISGFLILGAFISSIFFYNGNLVDSIIVLFTVITTITVFTLISKKVLAKRKYTSFSGLLGTRDILTYFLIVIVVLIGISGLDNLMNISISGRNLFITENIFIFILASTHFHVTTLREK